MSCFGWLCLAGCLAVASLGWAAPEQDKAKKEAKGPDIILSKLGAVREAQFLLMDGVVKNVSGRILRGVVLHFEFFDPDGKMISRKNTTVVEDELEDGETEEFSVQTPSPARAVVFRVEAEDSQGRYLRLEQKGPYPIR